MNRKVCRAAILLAVLLCGGCSQIGPRPWEKDLMARPEMQLSLSAASGSG